jgi:membrane-bound metal-dependent hydrolase YbcI (DUF457 family)
MTFYEHFFWNYTFFYRASWAWKVGLGGILPDLIYMAGFLPKIVSYQSFREWMHDPLWDTLWNSFLARSAHSLVIWGIVCLPFFIFRKNDLCKRLIPFLIGWGLHVIADALTHVSDGYPLFFPFSDYRFPAPVSYWEREFHAREFFVISHTLMAGLLLSWFGSKLNQYFRKRKFMLREGNALVKD